MSNTIQFARGASSDFSPTAASANTLYFLTDTNQIFLGGEEFSKGVEELSSAPAADLIGEQGKLYIYNKTLYTYLNDSWKLLGFTEWTKLTGFPTDEDPHILAYQDIDDSISPGVLIPLSKLKENLGIETGGSSEIEDGSITSIKIATHAIYGGDEGHIHEATITGYNIAEEAISTIKIAQHAVTGGHYGKIEEATITGYNLAEEAVSGGIGGHINSKTITGYNIADSAISLD